MKMTLSAGVALVVGLMTLGAATAVEAGPLTGHVRDQSANPIHGARVDAFDGTGDLVDSNSTDETGAYFLDIGDGTFDVRVTPPFGSLFLPAIVPGFVVTGPETLDFSLVLTDPAVFNGRVLDFDDVGIPGQSVLLLAEGNSNGPATTTDGFGRFSFSVPPGRYFVVVNGDNQGFSATAPHLYSLQTVSFDLESSVDMDLQLPLRRVTVRVVDFQNTPVAGAAVSSSNALNCTLPFGPDTACGASNYAYTGTPPFAATDATGTATLYLFPTPDTAETSYSFFATPLPAGTLAPGGVTGVAVVEDTTVTITLQPPTVLSGTLNDGAGDGFVSQLLTLTREGQEFGDSTITAAGGAYRLRRSPGPTGSAPSATTRTSRRRHRSPTRLPRNRSRSRPTSPPISICRCSASTCWLWTGAGTRCRAPG